MLTAEKIYSFIDRNFTYSHLEVTPHKDHLTFHADFDVTLDEHGWAKDFKVLTVRVKTAENSDFMRFESLEIDCGHSQSLPADTDLSILGQNIQRELVDARTTEIVCKHKERVYLFDDNYTSLIKRAITWAVGAHRFIVQQEAKCSVSVSEDLSTMYVNLVGSLPMLGIEKCTLVLQVLGEVESVGGTNSLFMVAALDVPTTLTLSKLDSARTQFGFTAQVSARESTLRLQ